MDTSSGSLTPTNNAPTTNNQQQQQQAQDSSNHSSVGSAGGGLFFADATLDLDEAHDIAETPEPPRRFLHVDPIQSQAKDKLRLPRLEEVGSSGSGGGSSPTLSRSPPSKGNNNNINNDPPTPKSANRSTTTSDTTDPSSPPTSDRSLNGPMNRITGTNNNNLQGQQSFGSAASSVNSRTRRFRSPPRWPRDLTWAVAFCIVVPLGLVFPALLWHRQNIFGTLDMNTTSPLALPILRHATFWSILLAFASALLLARGLYRTPGGGEGDDARYKASQFLLACVPMSVAMNVILVLAVYFLLPHALHYALIPLWYFIRDVYLFRRWKMQAGGGGVAALESPRSNVHSSQPNSTRHAFFQALTCMALDILSRSLRRNSFHRCIVTLLSLQLLVSMVWRWAILGALNTGNPLLVLLALIGGKWATGTIARLLSLISSGGVASWFAENAVMVEEQELQERTNAAAAAGAAQNGSNGNKDDTNKKENEEVGFETGGLPEEYRTADASIYQSVVDFDDEGMDDDDQDDFEYGFSSQGNSHRRLDDDDDYNYYDRSTPRTHSNPTQKPTVKSLFVSGVSVSFGSVAQCGLLGGPAQFLWCQLRKVDATRHAIVNRLQQQPRDFQPNRAVSIVMDVTGVNADGGFRGMQIGRPDNISIVQKFLNKGNVMARAFVRAHSDLAMSHVAAYYKSYKRAALDVSSLVEQAGMYISNGFGSLIGVP